jgi:PhoH-like ATPase
VIFDTNALIYNPQSIKVIIEGGNTVIIPSQVIFELDNLKNSFNIGFDVREAIRMIKFYRAQKKSKIRIHVGLKFTGRLTNLQKTHPDYIILGQVNSFCSNNKKRYAHIKFITHDTLLRVLAEDVLSGVLVEEYKRDKTKENELKTPVQSINFLTEEIKDQGDIKILPFGNHKDRMAIPLNSGVICNYKGQEQCVAIRREKYFEIIPEKISAYNIGPYNINNDDTSTDFQNKDNWAQAIAFKQLLDPSITCVFLQGKAGTGKTLIALAAALHQPRIYNQIIISRPAVPLENKDTMGFLPGDIKDKMDPWLKPIWSNLKFLGDHEITSYKQISSTKTNKKNKGKKGSEIETEEIEENGEKKPITKVQDMLNKEKIVIESLDYIRGQSFTKKFILIDEAQNLTPHQIKTIITRVGKGSKIVFTGDLGQIDRFQNLDRTSSGLSYAMTRMIGKRIISVINLPDGVRSELANLAEDLL